VAEWSIAVMAGLVLGYALLAKKFAAANITPPMLSVLAGVIVFSVAEIEVDTAAIHIIAELTLVIVLFHDASTVKLGKLKHDPGIAVRLLAIGFPIAIVGTYLLTWELLPTLGVAGAWLLAAAVTPTDAGLGAATMLNPVVPMRVRRALNVESGLNDGLATPLVLLALSALVAEEGATEPSVLRVGFVPVALAVILAVAGGLSTAWLMDRSRERRFSGHRGRAIATLVLPLMLSGLANVIGANTFITAFVGGLVFGAASRTVEAEPEASELLEVAADLLGFVVWFFAGGLVLAVFADGIRWQWLVVAVASLTALRIVPVWIALAGTGFRWQTMAFLGWFGPRGLATIVFGLLALEELGEQSPVMSDLSGVIALTVLLSVFAHGISAAPLSVWYGRWVGRTHPPIEDVESVEPMPSRGRHDY
jgi:NhaP-type Na+/H+ or K+/H+ antiporter